MSRDGTHHLIHVKERLYPHAFLHVLPFHAPGLAPAQGLDRRWCHVLFPSGLPAYRERFDRAFGFYQDLACVVQGSNWFHVHPDGERFNLTRDWAWAGNFQNGACVVRSHEGRYFHHLRVNDGAIVHGPYLYCGDFRERCAVVRLETTGLCTHVDLDGGFVHGKQFFELGVFHKGTALAKDARGWFHVDMQGQDVLLGKRFLSLEPFYNSQAAATCLDGRRVVIDESGAISHDIGLGHDDSEDRAFVQNLVTSYWPAMTVKCGLDLQRPFPPALELAWKELGLWHTRRGNLLEGEMRGIASYWLGAQLAPWLDASRRLERKLDFFEELTAEGVTKMHHVLELYSREWVKSVTDCIAHRLALSPFSSVVVDVGGGLGLLVDSLRLMGISAMLYERPEVAELASRKRPQISVIPGNFFTDSIPKASHFVLAHVLHDWNDNVCEQLIRKLMNNEATESIFIVERISTSEHTHALLGMNMAITTGGKERSWEEWSAIIETAGGKVEIVAELPNKRFVLEVSKPRPESQE